MFFPVRRNTGVDPSVGGGAASDVTGVESDRDGLSAENYLFLGWR